jgi:hypothetical protein
MPSTLLDKQESVARVESKVETVAKTILKSHTESSTVKTVSDTKAPKPQNERVKEYKI